MPGLSVTVGEQIEALRRVAGDKVVARIRREPDPAIIEDRRGLAAQLRPQARAGAGLQGRAPASTRSSACTSRTNWAARSRRQEFSRDQIPQGPGPSRDQLLRDQALEPSSRARHRRAGNRRGAASGCVTRRVGGPTASSGRAARRWAGPSRRSCRASARSSARGPFARRDRGRPLSVCQATGSKSLQAGIDAAARRGSRHTGRPCRAAGASVRSSRSACPCRGPTP